MYIQQIFNQIGDLFSNIAAILMLVLAFMLGILLVQMIIQYIKDMRKWRKAQKENAYTNGDRKDKK